MTPAPPRSFGDAVAVGVVTQNDDPESLGRVRVRYPALGDDTEGWWARVAAPAAGNGPRPADAPVVGDEVVVASSTATRTAVRARLALERERQARRPRPDGRVVRAADRQADRHGRRQGDLDQGQGHAHARGQGRDVDHDRRLARGDATRELSIAGRRSRSRRARRSRSRPPRSRSRPVVQVSGRCSSDERQHHRHGRRLPPARRRARRARALGHARRRRGGDPIILGTAPGERPMRPEFGCGIHDYVFESIDAYTLGRLDDEIRDALDRWEPRIEVLDVDFDTSGPSAAGCSSTSPTRCGRRTTSATSSTPSTSSRRGPRREAPEIALDDRRFQDLVNEARLRIGQPCPEWTEHNVSDPGITLIELFAWMTDMLIYRLNRVPDKLHVALLELLGISRRARRRHDRAALPARRAGRRAGPDPGRETEVGTVRTASDEAIVFQTSVDCTIPPARPMAYVVERGGASRTSAWRAARAARRGPTSCRSACRRRSATRSTSASTSRSRAAAALDVDCSQARGAGVDPEDPPLRWEVSGEQAGPTGPRRRAARPHRRLQLRLGRVELQLPERHRARVAGQRALLGALPPRRQHPLGRGSGGIHAPARDLLHDRRADRRARGGRARVAGGREMLGESDGTPGQRLPLRNAPVLELDPGETSRCSRVRTARCGGVGATRDVRRERRTTPLHARRRPRHDRARPRGARAGRRWRQYGRVPPAGAAALHPLPPRRRAARQRRRRHADGAQDRDPRRRLGHEPVAAAGGVDTETLESTRQRAAMEIRTRYRAVTAEDFEFLCGEASPRVARARCLPPVEDGGSRSASCRGSRPPTASSGARAFPDEDCCRRSPSTSTSAA